MEDVRTMVGSILLATMAVMMLTLFLDLAI